MAGRPKTLISISKAGNKIIVSTRLVVSVRQAIFFAILFLATMLIVAAILLLNSPLSLGDIIALLTQLGNLASALASKEK